VEVYFLGESDFVVRSRSSQIWESALAVGNRGAIAILGRDSRAIALNMLDVLEIDLTYRLGRP